MEKELNLEEAREVVVKSEAESIDAFLTKLNNLMQEYNVVLEQESSPAKLGNSVVVQPILIAKCGGTKVQMQIGA